MALAHLPYQSDAAWDCALNVCKASAEKNGVHCSQMNSPASNLLAKNSNLANPLPVMTLLDLDGYK